LSVPDPGAQPRPPRLQRVVFAGGGTGGHIYPGLVIADELRARYPQAQFLFVGSADRMEAGLIPAHGYPFQAISVHGLAGRLSPGRRLRALAELLTGLPLWQSVRILRRFRPDVVVGTGGYVCGPVLLAAYLLDLPRLSVEQNEALGFTTRIVSYLVQAAALISESSEQAYRRLASRRVRTCVVGNPIRHAILTTTREQGIAALQLDPARLTLAVMGGSLGSLPVNRLVVQALLKLAAEPWFVSSVQVLHLTGRGANALSLTPQQVQAAGLAYRAELYREDIHHVLAAADLAISRAGGGFLAESAVRGLPLIVIPIPHSAQDHQRANARRWAEAGAAVVLEEEQATGQDLAAVLRRLLQGDRAPLAAMAQAASSLARPDAAARVVDLIAALVTSPQRQEGA